MTMIRLSNRSTKWPFTNFPGILDLEGVRFQKVPARPGVLAEYEEVRGNRRVFCVWNNARIEYNWDHERQEHTHTHTSARFR